MIIILQCADLSCLYSNLEAEMVCLFHFGLNDGTTQRAELIIFVEDCHIHILKATKWPYGKPMSTAEPIQYIANHVA
jgi:hypothetical protein